MASRTKILDLYGIPACGKTTLAEYMTNHHPAGLKVAMLGDCIRSARGNKADLVRSISPRSVWASTRLKYAAPLDKKRRIISLRSLIMPCVLKNYARKYTDYDIILVDHGDIQSIVSLERGDNLHEAQAFRKACYGFIDASFSTLYVHCMIDVREALERMSGRGRDKGRIDLLQDPDLKRRELEEENKRFAFWTEELKNRGASLIELDMNDDISVISEKLFQSI